MFRIQLQQCSRWSIKLATHWLCLHIYIQTNLDHSSHQSLVIWTTVVQNVYVAHNLRHSIPFSHQENFNIFYIITWLYSCIWNTHFMSICHTIRSPTFIHTFLIQFSLLWFITNSSTDIHFLFIYTLQGFKTSGDTFQLPYSIAFHCSICPFLYLFHSWLYIFHLSRFFGGGLVFSFLQVTFSFYHM